MLTYPRPISVFTVFCVTPNAAGIRPITWKFDEREEIIVKKLLLALLLLLSLLAHAQSSAKEIWLGDVRVIEQHLPDYGTVFIAVPKERDNVDETFLRNYPEYLGRPLYNLLPNSASLPTAGKTSVSLIYLGDQQSYHAMYQFADGEDTAFDQFMQSLAIVEEDHIRLSDDLRIEQLVSALAASGDAALNQYEPNKKGLFGLGSGDNIDFVIKANNLYSIALEFAPNDSRIIEKIDRTSDIHTAHIQYSAASEISRSFKSKFQNAVKKNEKAETAAFGDELWKAYDLLGYSTSLFAGRDEARKLMVELGEILSRDYPRSHETSTLSLFIESIEVGIPKAEENTKFQKRTSRFHVNDTVMVQATTLVPFPGRYNFEFIITDGATAYTFSDIHNLKAGRYSIYKSIPLNELEPKIGSWEITVLADSGNALSADISIEPPKDPLADQNGMAAIIAKDYVKAQLVSPRTAKFEALATGKYYGDGKYVVSSFVDSQNRFGAMIRSYYTCTLLFIGNGEWRLVDLVIE